jgi:DnaK suppressor protein
MSKSTKKPKAVVKSKPVAKAKKPSQSNISVSKSKKTIVAVKPKAKPVELKKVAAKAPAKKVVAQKPVKVAPKKVAETVAIAKPVVAKPAVTKKVDAKPVDAKSTVTKKVEAKPVVAAKPVFSLPKLTKPMDPRIPITINKLTRMPISQEGNLKAIKKAKKQDPNKTRYTDKELKEFKDIILSKLENSRRELALLQAQITNANEHGTDDTAGTFKVLEDGSDTLAKEEAGQMAARQRKFIEQLEAALGRIENKTYGICRVTGKLIPKERLRAVPHTTQSIEAKLNQYRD